ncbi:hypothetical protein C492_15236 [Natronococcus jeotgali DSM 18795]|uniref:Uncharacterized protein n=1 Tax=Natronococcus jeotgali DSM 18795 TaxID=1227498 RepID=L9X5F2_9EURY|nr:hypothetical protein C492_15236 [Natronococcus jeotgali DSM 18795]
MGDIVLPREPLEGFPVLSLSQDDESGLGVVIGSCKRFDERREILLVSQLSDPENDRPLAIRVKPGMVDTFAALRTEILVDNGIVDRTGTTLWNAEVRNHIVGYLRRNPDHVIGVFVCAFRSQMDESMFRLIQHLLFDAHHVRNADNHASLHSRQFCGDDRCNVCGINRRQEDRRTPCTEIVDEFRDRCEIATCVEIDDGDCLGDVIKICSLFPPKNKLYGIPLLCELVRKPNDNPFSASSSQ